MLYKPWIYEIVFTAIIVLSILFQADNKPELPIIGQLPEFNLVDQKGQPFSLQDVKGSVWLADFIFTTCLGPCPIMTERMRMVQRDLQDMENLKFVSFTVNPDYDTPDVLSKYGERFRADTSSWSFVTGKYEQIQELVAHGFKMGDTEEIVFHSTRFALVDEEGNIRGYYSGTEPEEHETLTRDIKRLLNSIN
ncbi:MAG: SCO family protein [Candidatus Marinimicrobia bacterium]|jgi:protein SCO1/2|nr:SCO family protein [Candidatus Neomarinimicrobiota bacterium]|tara:strand:- start:496 stop:1074 length:579 start_codon:yes stop_codon:yes gene_type:complete